MGFAPVDGEGSCGHETVFQSYYMLKVVSLTPHYLAPCARPLGCRSTGLRPRRGIQRLGRLLPPRGRLSFREASLEELKPEGITPPDTWCGARMYIFFQKASTAPSSYKKEEKMGPYRRFRRRFFGGCLAPVILVTLAMGHITIARASGKDLPSGCSRVGSKLQGSIFSDDFDDYQGAQARPNWVLGPHSSISNGKLVLQGTRGGTYSTVKLCLPRTLNFSLTTELTLIEPKSVAVVPETAKTVIFVFRSAREAFPPYGSTVEFQFGVAGFQTFWGILPDWHYAVVGIPFPLEFERVYLIGIDAVGDLISLSVDNVTVMQHRVTDPEFLPVVQEGFFSIVGASAELDNLRIEILP